MDERNDMRYDRPVDTDVTGVTIARFKRLSWGAIFAGTVIVLVIQATLSLLGLAIGLGSTNPASEPDPTRGLATGAMVWWAVTFLISLFIGGYVTGRLGGAPRKGNGALHGLITWGLALLVFGFLLTSVIGTVMGGALGVLRSGLSAAGTVVAANTQNGQIRFNTGSQQGTLTWDDIRRELRMTLARGSGEGNATTNPNAVPGNTARPGATAGTTYSDADVEAAFDRLLRSGPNPSQADRDAAVNMLVARTNMTRSEAESTVDRWVTQYQGTGADVNQTTNNMETKARQVGQNVADVGSKAAAWGFVALVLGAIVAALGGMVGAPNEDVVVDRA